MIPQQQLEELWNRVTHHAPDCQVAIPQPVLAELLTELKRWRGDGVTEEMLRLNDGAIKVGRGCMLIRECDWPNNSSTPPEG